MVSSLKNLFGKNTTIDNCLQIFYFYFPAVGDIHSCVTCVFAIDGQFGVNNPVVFFWYLGISFSESSLLY